MTLTMEDMKLAVKHGSYWLDENYPGWAQKIDVTNLHMRYCTTCVIGQAVMHKGYTEVVREAAGDFEDNQAWAVDNGFDIYTSDLLSPGFRNDYNEIMNSRYDTLETLWTEEVKNRLG